MCLAAILYYIYPGRPYARPELHIKSTLQVIIVFALSINIPTSVCLQLNLMTFDQLPSYDDSQRKEWP